MSDPARRWLVKVYPDRSQWLKNATAAMISRWTKIMSTTFNVRADSRDEALHIGQEHRPDLKACVWEIEEVLS